MKKQKTIQSLLLIGLLFFTSCSTKIIRPTISESDFSSTASKKLVSCALYVTDDFKAYTVSETVAMAGIKWQFELGPCAIDAFRYGLASKFENVQVKLGEPRFPFTDSQLMDPVIIVEPSFDHFEVLHLPILFKFEPHSVKVSLKVKTYDSSGRVLLDKLYEAKGSKLGSVGFQDPGVKALPIASKIAIQDAVNKALSDIITLQENKVQ